MLEEGEEEGGKGLLEARMADESGAALRVRQAAQQQQQYRPGRRRPHSTATRATPVPENHTLETWLENFLASLFFYVGHIIATRPAAGHQFE